LLGFNSKNPQTSIDAGGFFWFDLRSKDILEKENQKTIIKKVSQYHGKYDNSSVFNIV
jgi:hypothetical protein